MRKVKEKIDEEAAEISKIRERASQVIINRETQFEEEMKKKIEEDTKTQALKSTKLREDRKEIEKKIKIENVLKNKEIDIQKHIAIQCETMRELGIKKYDGIQILEEFAEQPYESEKNSIDVFFLLRDCIKNHQKKQSSKKDEFVNRVSRDIDLKVRGKRLFTADLLKKSLPEDNIAYQSNLKEILLKTYKHDLNQKLSFKDMVSHKDEFFDRTMNERNDQLKDDKAQYLVDYWQDVKDDIMAEAKKQLTRVRNI